MKPPPESNNPNKIAEQLITSLRENPDFILDPMVKSNLLLILKASLAPPTGQVSPGASVISRLQGFLNNFFRAPQISADERIAPPVVLAPPINLDSVTPSSGSMSTVEEPDNILAKNLKENPTLVSVKRLAGEIDPGFLQRLNLDDPRLSNPSANDTLLVMNIGKALDGLVYNEKVLPQMKELLALVDLTPIGPELRYKRCNQLGRLIMRKIDPSLPGGDSAEVEEVLEWGASCGVKFYSYSFDDGSDKNIVVQKPALVRSGGGHASMVSSITDKVLPLNGGIDRCRLSTPFCTWMAFIT